MKTIAEKDIQAIEAHGLTVKQIEGQLKDFEKGFPYANLIEPATLEKGIVKLGKGQISDLLNEYESLIHKEKIVKFVPASGAATRMFKKLFALAETFTGSPEDYVSLAEDNGPMSLQFLFDNLDKLSFYDELKKTLLKDGLELEELIAGKQYGTIAEYILEEKGLGYGALPKGLILFHKYEDETRLALEEHFPEAYNYCLNEKGTSIHFTVSPEHLELFRKEAEYLTNKYHNLYGIRPEVSFSTQKSSTDTIAVTTDNAIFRDKQGQPVFRPAGHGALIENLNDLDAGIIFIKNIDNVVPDEQKEDTYTFKKACGALLLQLRNKTFEYLQQLDEADVTDDELQDMYDFAVNKLFVSPFSDFALMNRI